MARMKKFQLFAESLVSCSGCFLAAFVYVIALIATILVFGNTSFSAIAAIVLPPLAVYLVLMSAINKISK